ncbi:hypothetical protein JCM8547_002309 [Rhodosporidiobolus lusitaniae]
MPSVDTGLAITPLEHSAGFGAIVTGVDLNKLSKEDFKAIELALYTHRLLVVKDQPGLHPAKQYELNCRFDPGAEGKHGHGDAKSALKSRNLTGGLPSVPEADMVRIVGRGHLPAGHYGTTEPMELKAGSHQSWHKEGLTDKELESGITRFQRWHMDAQLAVDKGHTARVTTIYAHTLPKGPDVKLRWDDGSGQEMMVAPGRTAFMDSAKMYEALSDEEKQWVDFSEVEYAGPNPYEFILSCKGTSNGFSIVSDDLENLPLADKPGQRLPLVWLNPVTGERHLSFHMIVARRIYYRTSREGETKVIEDLREVRRMLDGIQRHFLREENIIIAPQEEGDLAIWLNRGTRHSAIEFPSSYGPRVMHQCHLAGSDPVEAPWPIEGQPNPLNLVKPAAA